MEKVTITWNNIDNHLKYQWTNAPKKMFISCDNNVIVLFWINFLCILNNFFEPDVMPCKERCMTLLHLIDKLLINQRPMLTLGAP